MVILLAGVTLLWPPVIRQTYVSKDWSAFVLLVVSLPVMLLAIVIGLLSKLDITDDGAAYRLGRWYVQKNRVHWQDVVLLEDDTFAGCHLYKFWVREKAVEAGSKRWCWGRLEVPGGGRLRAVFSVNNLTFARPVELLRDIVWRLPPHATVAPGILTRTGLTPQDVGRLYHPPEQAAVPPQ